MDIAPIDAAHELLKSAIGRPIRPSTGELNVEMLATNPLLPTSRKWAIRFNASGTVTIVLGMRDYGWGWYSAHFASLAAARLGLPFRWMRVYYTRHPSSRAANASRVEDSARRMPIRAACGGSRRAYRRNVWPGHRERPRDLFQKWPAPPPPVFGSIRLPDASWCWMGTGARAFWT
jgi:hypothetical protein